MRNIFRNILNRRKQKGFVFVIVAIGAAVAALVVMAIVPAINQGVMGGDWTVSSAIIQVNSEGYTATAPDGTVYVDDVLPNADSTFDVGAAGTEFAESYYDDFFLGGSEIDVTGISDLFMDCIVVTAAHVRSNEDLSAGTPITFTIDLQPDVPRTLSGHFDAHANVTAYTIVITGVDGKGDAATETLTEADLWDWETDYAFATITSIIMTARTGDGTGDTMDIGITDVLGLSNNINAVGDVYKIKKNAADEPVVAGDINAIFDTYDMATAVIGAADDFTIWYNGNISHID
uniref:Uncharacterized protein n=1 Tax=viral metagenome TaxID=1070528 RepID=A0A6M3M8L1_9ZZZZ